MSANLQNWAGHHTFSTARVHRPQTVEQLQALVSQSSKLKVLGSRHSFNDIADATGDLVSLDDLEPTFLVDRERHTVTVNGSITYGQLCQQLHADGYAIHNMASLPHITVAGAISTATHGSGDHNGNLATAVAALELVKANGDLVLLAREQNREEFEGAVVGLGAVGAITKVTLDIAPAFVMQQEVYEDLPVAQVEAHFDEITSSAYSVSLFTDWQKERVNQLWLKRHLTNGAALAVAPTLFEAIHAPAPRHPVTALPAAPCTEQMGVVGPWHERLPHFRVDHTPASGDELQTEYFVPRQHAVEAMRAVIRILSSQGPIESLLWISEVRTVAADSLWMSPSYQRDSVGIHFSWRKNWAVVQKLLPTIEEAFAPFQARPHWGKLFTMSPVHLQSLYPKLPEFRELLHAYDPQGKFRNPYVDKYIFGTEV
ncbi:MAG: FAD-binding protein [Caldilineaceae bacterium]|nr:FAD-binding protein [Caldilineaceae bacterium]